MPPKKRIAPIPSRWITPVVGILRDGETRNIRWTLTAEREFPLFGFTSKQQAYESVSYTHLTLPTKRIV